MESLNNYLIIISLCNSLSISFHIYPYSNPFVNRINFVVEASNIFDPLEPISYRYAPVARGGSRRAGALGKIVDERPHFPR